MKHIGLIVLNLLIVTGLSGCRGKSADEGSSEKTQGSSQATSAQSSDSEGKPDKSGEAGATPSDVVKIVPADQARAGIQTGYVLVQKIPRSLTVAGQVVMDEQHTSHVGTIADGRITAVNVLAGTHVQRGQVLGALHSHTVHETVGSLKQAYAAVDREQGALVFARQAQQRYHHLYAIQAASLEESQRSDQQVLEAEKLLVDAQASVRMEREHLSELLQIPPDSLNATNLYDRELIPIRSPIDGVVVARNISLGQVVDTGFNAFDISNLSTVWVTAAVNQQDLPLIHQGALAQIVTSGYPDQAFAGYVGQVGDTANSDTRTIPVRVIVPNPGTRLRPGMFASAQIAEPSTRLAVFVPEDALQDISGMKVVFVVTDGQTFRARTVTLGTRSNGKAEVKEGLSPGDRIVINGAFMVKSEMLKGTMGDG